MGSCRKEPAVYRKSLIEILVAVSSLSLATAFAGCASPTDDAPMGPPPADDSVYPATAATESDIGVAKWGYTKDPATDVVVFHGYDDHNAKMVELRQTTESTSADTARVTVTMSGKVATGSEKIDFFLKPSADGKSKDLSMQVVENTFASGGAAARVLARLGADTKAGGAGAPSLAGGNGSLTQSHPLDDGLVGRCSDTTVCTSELIDQKVAAAAATDKCGLVKPGAELLVATGVGFAAGGPLGALAGGLGGLALAGFEELGCIDARKDATKADQAAKDCQTKAQASCGK
jgi:hypothetical protein